MNKCPLCESQKIVPFHSDKIRPYFQCNECKFVFVPSSHFPSKVAEKSVYDLHENSPDDPGYRKFLNKLCAPLSEKLEPNSRGIDYGCGPAPVLSSLFEERGFSCANYDPFFADNKSVLEKRYDFLSCSEAIEHFHNPKTEFEKFISLVKPNGWIGIMTQMVRSPEAFKTWRYIADETHVGFFSVATFQWLANRYNLRVQFPADSIALFHRR